MVIANNPIYNKYLDKLKEMNLSLNLLLNQPDETRRDLKAIYSNHFNLIKDLVNEVIRDKNTKGMRIDLISDLINDKDSIKVLNSMANYKKNGLNIFYSNVFDSMVDAYVESERDFLCLNKLQEMMNKNVFLKNFRDTNFILAYPDLLKDIYANNLEVALTSICETLSENTGTVETNFTLASLLTYISAALELPDVYIYSKEMLLELSMLKRDYVKATEVITDLEDMNYVSSSLKYYKALIRQKKPNNILKYIKNLEKVD